MRTASRKPSDALPGKLGALSKLPVFFDLAGRRAVLAGGSAGAAWKAELLAATGANVDVYAPEPSDEMRTLLARGAAVDAADAFGNTALMYACARGHSAVVGRLISAGAARGHANKYGLGAADWAKWSKEADAIGTLIGE